MPEHLNRDSNAVDAEKMCLVRRFYRTALQEVFRSSAEKLVFYA